MRVPLSWLEEFLYIEGFSAEDIAERLSLQSVEAEVHPFGIDTEGVVFGKIVSVKPHPERDDLAVVKVLVGENLSVQVVTADRSVKEGDGVFVALPNSKVGGRCVTKRELSGIISEGVLLSAQELGLEDKSSGVLRVEEEFKPGTDAGFILGFGEKIIELDITPNRGDLLSVRGLARELSAILGLRKKERPYPSFEETGELSIEILDDDCWRYRGVLIEGVKVDRSPLRIRKRLWQCGLKSVNNVVDITNYILLQEGQPLHAFDFDKLKGGVKVRRATAREEITTLDGKRRVLDEEVLVIADEEKPVAVAGVMGGLESSVTEETRRVLLEAAYFDPRRVRRASKGLGIQTESSYRFERNVDIERVNASQDMAASMILEVAGGRIVALRDVYRRRYEPRKVFLPLGKYMRYAGEAYKNEEVSRILEALDIPHEIKRCGVEVFVPSHRSFDIFRDVDVIEELMRVKGYDHFKPEPVKLPSKGGLWRDKLLEVKKFLRDRGLEEVINISYEDGGIYETLGLDKPVVEIVNPLVPTQRYMRSSLIPSLLRTALFNDAHYNHDIGIFEVGRVFSEDGEEERVGVLLKGKVRDFPKREWGPYDLAELVQGIARIYGAEVSLDNSRREFLHPHVQAKVLVGDKEIGVLGKLHPRIADELELKGDVFLAEVTLRDLLRERLPHYEPLSKFPPVIRDLAIVVDKNLPVSKLLNEIKSQLGEMVEEVAVFDVYSGKEVGEGKKSVGVRMVFRSRERSLSSEEVNSSVEELLRRLRERLGAEIR